MKPLLLTLLGIALSVLIGGLWRHKRKMRRLHAYLDEREAITNGMIARAMAHESTRTTVELYGRGEIG